MGEVGAIPRFVPVFALFAGASGAALAQDSVSAIPGSGDAISAYGPQQSALYVVDGAPVLSSWSNEYLVAPIAKASRAVDPFFLTEFMGAVSASADMAPLLTFPQRSYAVWNAAGAGVNPLANSPANLVSLSGFERQQSAAFTDVGPTWSNVVGVEIGRRFSEPARFYVRRTVAVASRANEGAADTAVLTAGAVDAQGRVRVRADGLGHVDAGLIAGDNALRVDLPLRNPAIVNRLSRNASDFTTAVDAAATPILLNALPLSLGVPAAAPSSLVGGSGLTFAPAFDNTIRRLGGVTSNHLAPGVSAQRGNLSFGPWTTLGPGGLFACLGASEDGGGACDTINVWGLNADGTAATPRAAVLPAAFSEPGFSAPEPFFIHWDSQQSFRGGAGPVALGFLDSGEVLAAATARAADGKELIALATMSEQSSTWTVVARKNTPVLSGALGSQVGRITSAADIGSPVAFSSPAMDATGNIYFLSAFKPNIGPPVVAFIKAVNTASGYRLERILSEGQTIVGPNSTRSYLIADLRLADGDSLAAGSFYSGSITPIRMPGAEGPESPQSFAGAVLAAVLEYDNNAAAESYDALLLVAPRLFPISGDFNGDGVVNSADLAIMLGAWGPGGGPTDLNADGFTNSQDLAILLGNWG